MPVVRTIRVRADRVRFPAPRQKTKRTLLSVLFFVIDCNATLVVAAILDRFLVYIEGA